MVKYDEIYNKEEKSMTIKPEWIKVKMVEQEDLGSILPLHQEYNYKWKNLHRAPAEQWQRILDT